MARQYFIGGPLGGGYVADAEDRDAQFGGSYVAQVATTGGVSVSVSGQAVTASAGTSTVTTVRHVSTTAATQVASVSVGSVTVTGKANVSAATQVLTASVGTAVAHGAARTIAAGQALSTSVGGVTVTGKARVSAATQALTTSVGPVEVAAGGAISVNVTGLPLSVTSGHVVVHASPALDAWDWTRVTPDSIVLSNGDNTATVPVDITGELWSTTGHDVDKWYVEVEFAGDDPDGHVGLLDDEELNGAVLRADGTVEVRSGGSVVPYPIFAALESGDTVGMALNGDEGKVWFRINGGDWNNNADIQTPPETSVVPRPYGLDYTVPGYGSAYNYLTDVPVPHVKWSTGNGGGPFANTVAGMTAAITAARAANQPLFFDVAQNYAGLHVSNKLPHGLYGRPGVIITYNGPVSSGTACHFYLTDRNCIVRGIEFRTCGYVFGMSTRSQSVARGFPVAWDIHGSRRSAYGTRRCIDLGTAVDGSLPTAGLGVPLDYTVYPESTATIGPSIEISDCKFVNCELSYFAWSDMIAIGRVDFHRNELVGTFGGFAAEGSQYTHIHAVNNLWRDCTGSRQSNFKIGRASTFATAGCGGDNSNIDIGVRTQTVYIANNEARDIESKIASDGTNAGVFSDIRVATPTIVNGSDATAFTYGCSVEVSFNKVVRVWGVFGQEDSNAFYFKTRGFLVEGNYVEACGSYCQLKTDGSGDLDSEGSRNGPESSGTEFKQPGDATIMANSQPGAKLVHRGNEWVNQPPKQSHDKIDPVTLKHSGAVGSVCGSNDCMLPVFYIGEIHRNNHVFDTTGSCPTLVRHYHTAPSFSVMCCEFHNCSTAGVGGSLSTSPAGLIGMHDPDGMTPTLNEISNNRAYSGADVVYTTDTSLIKKTGGGSVGATRIGLNKVYNAPKGAGSAVGNMTSFSATATSVVRTYTRPTVEV